MYFVPCDLTIEGRGSLLPEERRTIYAPIAGTIMEVPVEHGDIVKKGDVIARLDSRDLQKELKKLIAERRQGAESDADLRKPGRETRIRRPITDMQYQVQAQLAEADLTAKSSAEQIEIVQEQIEMM